MEKMPRIKKKWQRERLKLIASRAAHQRDNLWHQEKIKALADLVKRSNEAGQKLADQAAVAQANNQLLMKELGALQDQLHEEQDKVKCPECGGSLLDRGVVAICDAAHLPGARLWALGLVAEVRKLKHFRDQVNGFPEEDGL